MDGGKRGRLGVKGCRVAKLEGAIYPKILENYSTVQYIVKIGSHALCFSLNTVSGCPTENRTREPSLLPNPFATPQIYIAFEYAMTHDNPFFLSVFLRIRFFLCHAQSILDNDFAVDLIK
jgi:hypothetical protein